MVVVGARPKTRKKLPARTNPPPAIELQNVIQRKNGTNITNNNNIIILASNTTTTIAPSSKKKMKMLINFAEENKKS